MRKCLGYAYSKRSERQRKSPAIRAGLYVTLDTSPFDASPFDLDVDARTRPSDLDARLAHAAALFDGYVAVTHTSADGDVVVAVHAVLVAQRSDAVFPADPIGTRRQRKRGRRPHRERDGKNMSWSHSSGLHWPPRGYAIKRVSNDDVPRVPPVFVANARRNSRLCIRVSKRWTRHSHICRRSRPRFRG